MESSAPLVYGNRSSSSCSFQSRLLYVVYPFTSAIAHSSWYLVATHALYASGPDALQDLEPSTYACQPSVDSCLRRDSGDEMPLHVPVSELVMGAQVDVILHASLSSTLSHSPIAF